MTLFLMFPLLPITLFSTLFCSIIPIHSSLAMTIFPIYFFLFITLFPAFFFYYIFYSFFSCLDAPLFPVYSLRPITLLLTFSCYHYIQEASPNLTYTIIFFLSPVFFFYIPRFLLSFMVCLVKPFIPSAAQGTPALRGFKAKETELNAEARRI